MNWLKHTTHLSVAAGLCLTVACGTGEEGDEPIERPDSPESCEMVESGMLSEGGTLSSSSCYVIDGELHVTSGSLVIEPGTTIFMGAGSSINLSGTGRIEASGEENKEILIRGVEEDRGFWSGIELYDTGTQHHIFNYVTIRHAGGDQFTGASDSSGAIYVRGEARLSVSNSAFESNAYAGLHVATSSATLALGSTSFSENEIPLRLRPDQFAQLDADLTIANNDSDTIVMGGGGGAATVVESGTWPAYTYEIPRSITLNADITIASGATFEFGQDVRVTVQSDKGSLVIDGTEGNPVILRAGNGERGGWAGIYYEDASSSSNRISHTIVADGGGDAYTGNGHARGAVYVAGDAARLTIDNTSFENNAYAALHVASHDGQVEVSASSFISNEYPVLTRPNHIGGFNADLSFSDNEYPYIAIYLNSTGSTTTLTRDATWPAFEVPIRLRASVNVHAHLTLSPGSILEVESDLGIDVNQGRLTADASGAEPIVFTSSEALTGYWQGIRFSDSRYLDNKLINVDLINAGSDRWTGNPDTQAALLVYGDSRVTVADLTITGSGHHGINVGSGGELVGCSGLSVSGSASVDYFGAVDGPSACLEL